MTNKIARGTIVFEYYLDQDPYPERFEGMSDEEIKQAMIEDMVEDVISISYSDLAPCIEMELVDEA